jgi:hypothetical protein
MIQLGGRTLRLIIDARAVELERILARINGDTDWSLDDGGLKIRFRASRDVRERGDSASRISSVVSASIGARSCVGVACLRVEAFVADHIGEGPASQTPAAACVSFGS